MKRKIAFVIESLELGGAEKSLVTLLQNLDYSRYEVDLISLKPEGFFKDFVPEEVARVIIQMGEIGFIDRIRFAIEKKLYKNYHSAQLHWKNFKKYFTAVERKYDIVIAYNQGFATYFVSEFIEAPKKYAWVNTDYQKAGYNIEFDYPIYKSFDKIITVSPEGKISLESALQKMGKSLNIEVIKDITDEKVLHKQALLPMKVDFLENKVNIVTVARLVEYKGLSLAIDACRILKSKKFPVNWYIIGEGVERKNLATQIQEKELTEDFFLLGADANPYPYMKNAEIYVQTSLFEGLGLTVIEAALLHKPIVSTNFPTVYGIIEDEKTGLIAEMNAEDIAEKIESLILNPDLRNRLIENLKNQKNSDKETTLRKVQELLES